MMSVACAIEPLRAANRALGREAYRWQFATGEGQPARASNGMQVEPHLTLASADVDGTLFVCAGTVIEPPEVATWRAALRRAARQGHVLGAVSNGAWLLAGSGLLDGHRCTIHWESRPAFIERFPAVHCTRNLFEIDGARITCAGGTAALDLMLHLIEEDAGAAVAAAVANQFIHQHKRSHSEHQRAGDLVDLTREPLPLQRAVTAMQQHVEAPRAAAAIARDAGVSLRQLERLFSHHLGLSPARFYLNLRLERARELLLHTHLSVVEVAVATGFASSSNFALRYRTRFGTNPSHTRTSTHQPAARR